MVTSAMRRLFFSFSEQYRLRRSLIGNLRVSCPHVPAEVARKCIPCRRSASLPFSASVRTVYHSSELGMQTLTANVNHSPENVATTYSALRWHGPCERL